MYTGRLAERVGDNFTGGSWDPVGRLLESYRPQNQSRWDEYVNLVAEGRLREACDRFTERRLSEAMVVDDLPVILGGSVDLTVKSAFDDVTQNWRKCFQTASYSNFRQQTVAMFEDLEVDNQQGGTTPRGIPSGTIPVVPEGHGYDESRLNEMYEYAELETYGITFGITRHMLYDDNKRAFAQIPAKMGTAMARTINWQVANMLEAGASTSVSGMTLRDATRLFSTTASTRGNMVTGTYPLTYNNVITVMALFSNITSPQGRVLNLKPKYLIVPPELQYAAERICTAAGSDTRLLATTTANVPVTDYDILKGRLEVVVLEELTSQVDWYLAADPAIYSTCEVGFLNGRQTPELFQQSEVNLDLHSSDGITYKIRHDFDAYAVDFRGIFKVDDAS